MTDDPYKTVLFIEEGWWHYNVRDGRVHDHPDKPGRNWSFAAHRLCRKVYTRQERPPVVTGVERDS